MADWRDMKSAETAMRKGYPVQLWLVGTPEGELSVTAHWQDGAWIICGTDEQIRGTPIGWLPRPAPPEPDAAVRQRG